MLSDAYVEVTCDGCHVVEVVTLTAIACRGWDKRNVRVHLEGIGWTVDGDNHQCDECTKAAKELEKKTKKKTETKSKRKKGP